jgi:prolyl oligopeptidase
MLAACFALVAASCATTSPSVQTMPTTPEESPSTSDPSPDLNEQSAESIDGALKADETPAPLPPAPALTQADFDAWQRLNALVQNRAALTRRDDIVETLHGVQIADPYRWLEDEKSPEVIQWMAEEDALARQTLAKTQARSALSARMRQLFYAESWSIPVVRQDRLFFMRTHRDREKAILYVRDGQTGPERVLLDPNTWSADGTVSLGAWNPSPDGKKLAYSVRPNAADEATLYVLDVDSGEHGPEKIEGAKYAWPSWAPNSRGFYYGRLPVDPTIPVSERPGYTRIFFHRLGTDARHDALIHDKTGDPTTFLHAEVSRDGSALFVTIQRGWSETDLLARDLTGTDPTFRLIAPGKGATYELIDTWQGHHYFVTDEGAPNRRVMRVPVKGDLSRDRWTEVVPEDPNAALELVRLVGGKLALVYLKDAASVLRLASLDGRDGSLLALPGLGSVESVTGAPDRNQAFFNFTSYVTPREIHTLDVQAGTSQLWAASSVKDAFDARQFTVERQWFKSKDGTPISIFLVHKKDLVRDGQAPTLLYGYGGFMVSMTPTFRASIIPWLEAGGVYAVPNLRGGGEYGKRWHDAGRGALKQNVFDDFIAAAEWLEAEGYTNQNRLAIYGGSNGGLLVGAAMVQRPDLFRAVVCAVPLLDMLRYHLFGSGRTWIPEYGTAEKPSDFEVLRAYTPYSNVTRGTDYPALLMLSADHDDRVDPMHARKFVAAIRDASPATPTLLRIEKNAGHGGADQVEKSIEQNADMYGFLFEVFGMTMPKEKP